VTPDVARGNRHRREDGVRYLVPVRAGHEGRRKRGARLQCADEALDGKPEYLGFPGDGLRHEEHGAEVKTCLGQVEDAEALNPGKPGFADAGFAQPLTRHVEVAVTVRLLHLLPEELPGPRVGVIRDLLFQPADVALGVVGQQKPLGPREHQQGGIEVRPRADVDGPLSGGTVGERGGQEMAHHADYFLIFSLKFTVVPTPVVVRRKRVPKEGVGVEGIRVNVGHGKTR
jgi:hypothetical protein